MSSNLPGAVTCAMNCRLPAPTIVTAVKNAIRLSLLFMCPSSSFTWGEAIGQFIGIAQLSWLYLPEAVRRLEAEGSRRNFVASLPVTDIERVLRRARDFGARDYIAAGIRVVSLSDPDLDIDLLHAKGEVIAFGAANNTAAQIFYLGDLRHQTRIYV